MGPSGCAPGPSDTSGLEQAALIFRGAGEVARWSAAVTPAPGGLPAGVGGEQTRGGLKPRGPGRLKVSLSTPGVGRARFVPGPQ